MLVDDIRETMLAGRDQVPRTEQSDLYGLLLMLSSAQRFVLSPLVTQTIHDMVDIRAVRSMARNLFLPGYNTWVEWTDDTGDFGGGRVGALLMGAWMANEDGHVTIASPRSLTMGSITMFRRPIVTPSFGILWRSDFSLAKNDIGEFQYEQACAWIWTAIAMINTPRVARIESVSVDRINRARRNRPPVLSYANVMLTVDAGEAAQGAQNKLTGKKALHHVRAFMRLKRGRVEIVKPHWRGNPTYGVRLTRHTVRRAEDEPGEWQGGVLPPAQIISNWTNDDE